MKYSDTDIERIADYYYTFYSPIIRIDDLKLVAKRMLEKGITVDAILDGYHDKDIYLYMDEVVISREQVEKTYDYHKKVIADMRQVQKNKQKLRIKRVKVLSELFLLSSVGLGLIIGVKDISLANKNKEERNENSELLAAIAGLKSSSVASHSKDVIEGKYDGGAKVITYEYDVIAQDIINGSRKNPRLFDYYLFDTYYEVSKSKSTVAPLALFDDVLDEIIKRTKDDGELVEVYNRIYGCNTFLDYLYERGFVPPTDEDYYDLEEDISRYYVLKLAGVESPIDKLPEISQKRIGKLISAFVSQDYENVLKGEFANDLATLIDEEGKIL